MQLTNHYYSQCWMFKNLLFPKAEKSYSSNDIMVLVKISTTKPELRIENKPSSNLKKIPEYKFSSAP